MPEDDGERTLIWRPAPAMAAVAPQHVLLLRQEAGLPRRVALVDTMRIGRSPNNDLVLDSP